MSLKKTEHIWHNGKTDSLGGCANIHVLSHVVSYGSSVFEGIRCYETSHGPASFRLRDHMRRLHQFRPHLPDGESVFDVEKLSRRRA